MRCSLKVGRKNSEVKALAERKRESWKDMFGTQDVILKEKSMAVQKEENGTVKGVFISVKNEVNGKFLGKRYQDKMEIKNCFERKWLR